MKCASSRQGLAMVAVLLVLMALFVLSAPFLVTVRNADQASSESADRALMRVTLDAADRHALARLAASHPAIDPTPYFDDEEELRVSNRFPEGFLDTDDPRQTMWGAEAADVAGRIDLASAPPQVFANLMGGAARLVAGCTDKSTELEVGSTAGFLDEGVVWVDNELIGYAERSPTKFLRLTRGLLVKSDEKGEPLECGPSPAGGHEVGAFVLDQRAFALCEWRTATGSLRPYESLEELRGAADFMLGPGLGREAYLALEATTSAHGHLRAGALWQRPARVTGEAAGEPQYGCKVPVDDLRWFNPGTTVCITDGTNTEYGLVRATEENLLVLAEPLRAPFKAYETLVAPLARRPVNVNTATPAVLRALWTNLKLRGKSARITSGEAEELVDLVLVSRPFTGFEDFLRRAVLPAGGLDELPPDSPVRPEKLEELARDATTDPDGRKVLKGFLDADDARALYKNALNANDNELEFATLPLCFTARDVYQLELRAAVNAPSGVQRAVGRRDLVELVVPQQDLLQVWTRQEDFDEAPRLDLGAAAWLSGPQPTARPDTVYGPVTSLRWPTRARAHLGPFDTQVGTDLAQTTLPYVFATRADEDGFAQLAASREEPSARRASYWLQFDDESKELEGRFLPDEAPTLDLTRLGWSGNSSLMRGMAASLWLRPRELEDGARILDVSGPFTDSDRLSLLFDAGDLVLRVLDGAGDHPTSTFLEQSEVRFPLAGAGPGLPLDTWSHVQLAVEGTRPDQLALWVDGRRAEETPGLTRLTAPLGDQSDTLQVESTQGFPDKCVLRIGDELIEAYKTGEKGFTARHQSTGENAGFGGRIAREISAGYPEQSFGIAKGIDHPSGSTVQLYGYSLPIFSNVPNVAGDLPGELGLFGVGLVEGIVVNGSERRASGMEPITAQGNLFTFDYGHGLDGKGDDVEALLLLPTDPNRPLEETMKAFDPDGGYAAILGVTFGANENRTKDINGTRIGGVEVIRYSGWQGNRLNIAARGDQVTELARLQGRDVNKDVAGRASFVISYETGDIDYADDYDGRLGTRVMVMPISVAVRGGSGPTGFDFRAGLSSFAQITRTGPDSHLTEWVRYDEIAPLGSRLNLVRDNPDDLIRANQAAHPGWTSGVIPTPPTRPPTNVLGPPVASQPEPAALGPVPLFPASRAEPSVQDSRKGGAFWDYAMGQPDDEDFTLARAVNSHFQFRGVLGTYQHEHPQGSLVLPVFRTRNFDETGGWPGRFDHVMFLSTATDEPGFEGVVHRAHRPFEYLAYSWRESGGNPLAPEEDGDPANLAQIGFDTALTHVALEDRLAVPLAPTPLGDSENPNDSRILARMLLFPSGELPREVQQGLLGGDARARGSAPAVIADEALFFPSFVASYAGQPGQLVLEDALAEGDKFLKARKDVVRTPLGDNAVKANLLASWPANGGLLRIGDELLCYDTFDSEFVFTLPAGGRGLLGTDVQPHRPSESITLVGALPVGILGANIGADDAGIPLLALPDGFPSQGLVRIEDELVHYTRHRSGILEMPRGSAEAGKMDEKGPGLFRGRFGTQRAAHTAGTPVILHPFRYWDLWSELADAPEMGYFTLTADQPDAYWKRVFWKVGAAGFAGPALGVLQRTNPDTPWDAPAEIDNGLALLSEGKLDGGGNRIEVQSDRVEWRVFVRHLPDSFDPLEGLSHGWKTTPRLELFGVEFLGPNRTLARVDR